VWWVNIIAANINRRHLTKGQRAVALAMARPEPEKGGRGQKAFGDRTVSRERLSLARLVLRHDPDLAAQVLTGSVLGEAVACRRSRVSLTNAV
jgi:hypothetical protein